VPESALLGTLADNGNGGATRVPRAWTWGPGLLASLGVVKTGQFTC